MLMMAQNVVSVFSRSLRSFCYVNSIKYHNSFVKRHLFGMSASQSNSNKPPPQSESEIPSDGASQTPEELQLTEKEKTLTEENIKLTELVTEIDDKYKRALADGENTRIRMRKQMEEVKMFGIQNFCKDLLDVSDVLRTAVDTVPKDAISGDVLKNLFEGIQMTEKQLQSVFKRHGLTQINPIGEKFNPNDHHALFQTIEEGKEPGTVAIVTKVGYKLHDRTIRPAMVGVVKAKT